MNVQEILQKLVAIPTPSAVSNLPLLDWVSHFLEVRGWQTKLFPYVDESGEAKANLIARPAGGERNGDKIAEAIGIAFVCHTDTGPYSASWPEALTLSPSADGKLLHGCGSCAVKGALACFLGALDQLDTELVRPDIALILTADGETGSQGLKHLLDATNLKIGSAIVSAPTSLRPGVAGRGYALARVSINGIEAHSAFPKEGLSAILLAARLMTRIEGLERQFAAAVTSDALFDPPRTTLNVGFIEGGSTRNIIPAHCSFLVEWRPIPSDSPRSILMELEWLADGLRVEEPQAHIHVESLWTECGFARSKTDRLLQRLLSIAALQHSAERTPVGIGFGSEASRLSKVAEERIVMGPGDIRTAHSERECVPVAELTEWTATLQALLSAC